MSRVAIIAAMPGELKPLVRGWRRESRNGVVLWSWRHREGEWIAACAGTGVNAATRAFAEIERTGAIDSVFSTGWAGALNERHAVGRAYRISGIVDARTGARIPVADSFEECWLVTSPRVADRSEKRRLAADFGASLVDMEAAAVASLAGTKGIRFFCVKGVSDGVDDRLPDFNDFVSLNGRFQMARFVLFAIFRPWLWPALLRMGRNCRKAAQCIRESLLKVLDDGGDLRNPIAQQES
jgi:adenosylhomocysteine nucleosidase